jgi:hypothetical protein
LALAACTTASAPGVTTVGHNGNIEIVPPNSWVGTASNNVLLVLYTRSADSLQGTMDDSYLNTDGLSVKSEHSSFGGVINGPNITLNFPQGFGTSNNISGTIGSSALTLVFPDPTTATLLTVVLHPGSTNDFNAAVAALQATATTNAEQAAQAQAQAAEAQAQAQATAQAQAQLQGAIDAAANDVAQLNQLTQRGMDFSSFNSDLATAKSDLATTQRDAAKAINEVTTDPTSACYDAHGAVYDANGVGYDLNSINYDVNGAQSTIDEVNRLISKLQSDYSTYQAVAQSQGRGIDQGIVNAVSDAISNANDAVNTWKGQMAAYVSQVQQLVDQANAAANSATQAACK